MNMKYTAKLKASVALQAVKRDKTNFKLHLNYEFLR